MEKEKKEIGIEKLIELLNEYDPYIASDGEHRDNLWGYAYQGHSAVFPKELAESYIISARYGFIKWLVENDKIDNKKVADETYVKVNGEWYELILGCHYDLYQQTLMLLAISDTPIDFLCSLLK